MEDKEHKGTGNLDEVADIAAVMLQAAADRVPAMPNAGNVHTLSVDAMAERYSDATAMLHLMAQVTWQNALDDLEKTVADDLRRYFATSALREGLDASKFDMADIVRRARGRA